MSNINFDSLIFTLTESVVKAQSFVELNHIRRIARQYFEKDNKNLPFYFDINLPSLQEPGTEDAYRIPLLTLVPHANLIVKEAKISFDVDISSITAQDLAQNDIKEDQELKTIEDYFDFHFRNKEKANILVDPSSGGVAARKGNAAKIELKLETADISEGLARLLNDVVQTQGIYKKNETEQTAK